MGDLENLVNIDKIKSYLTTYKEYQEMIVDYLFEVYKTTEKYERETALNISRIEFTTSLEIFELTGIESISYIKEEFRYILSGSTDMFFKLPHLVSIDPDELYPDYLFKITSIGDITIKDIEKNYIYYDSFIGLEDDENFAPNFLPYSYNFNFLIDCQANFDNGLRFEFLKQNKDDFIYTYTIRTFTDLEIFLEFIMEDNVIYENDYDDYSFDDIPNYKYIIDLKNYDLHICFDRYKEDSEISKEELIKYFSLLFKTVHIHADDYLLMDNLGSQGYLDYISNLRKSGIEIHIYKLGW